MSPPRRRRRCRGFSLIEAVIVVTILGVLLSISVPSFRSALEQSRADLAMANLRAVWAAERAYWLDHGQHYTDRDTLIALGLLDPALAAGTFYSYDVSTTDGRASFTATATRAGTTAWSGGFAIDPTGTLSGELQAPGQSPILPPSE